MVQRTLFALISVLASTNSLVLASEKLADGFYVPSQDGPVQLELPDGENVKARLLFESTAARKVVFRSTRNDNTQYEVRVDTESSNHKRRLFLVAGGNILATMRYLQDRRQSEPGDQWHSHFVDLPDDDLSIEHVAKVFKARIINRKHPGHRLSVSWVSTKKSFSEDEEVILKMTITNVGEVPVSFLETIAPRAPRNNQFDFICRGNRGSGKAVPDSGDYMRFGGTMSITTLKRGESFTKEVDIKKWFRLVGPDTYRITGIYRMDIQSPNEDHLHTLWDEVAAGECMVSIQ